MRAWLERPMGEAEGATRMAVERRLVGRVAAFWTACQPSPSAWPTAADLCAAMPAGLGADDRARCVVADAEAPAGATLLVPSLGWRLRHLGGELARGAHLTPEGTPTDDTYAGLSVGPQLVNTPESLLGLLLSRTPLLVKRGTSVNLGGADKFQGELVVLRAVLLPLAGARPGVPGGCLGAANMKVRS
jgi:hypothetical protein